MKQSGNSNSRANAKVSPLIRSVNWTQMKSRATNVATLQVQEYGNMPAKMHAVTYE